MKILGFNNTILREKNGVNNVQKNNIALQKNENEQQLLQDIKLKNFSATIDKMKTEDSLDDLTIEALRNELKSSDLTSEKIADNMIDYLKKNSWHKRI